MGKASARVNSQQLTGKGQSAMVNGMGQVEAGEMRSQFRSQILGLNYDKLSIHLYYDNQSIE